jgi:hypothetical protein
LKISVRGIRCALFTSSLQIQQLTLSSLDDAQMTLTYQVGGGGHLDVDVYLLDPNNDKLFQLLKKDTGTYSLTAQHTGKYQYCFSNEFSTVSDKTVRFVITSFTLFRLDVADEIAFTASMCTASFTYPMMVK